MTASKEYASIFHERHDKNRNEIHPFDIVLRINEFILRNF